MTEIILARLPEPLPKNAVFVPVPTASKRVRARGYDQAILLAKALSRATSTPCHKVLVRHGNSQQVGASRAARQQQLRAAFSCKDVSHLQDSCVILVDDVLTTGATLEAAANALQKSGIGTVQALTFAQA